MTLAPSVAYALEDESATNPPRTDSRSGEKAVPRGGRMRALDVETSRFCRAPSGTRQAQPTRPPPDWRLAAGWVELILLASCNTRSVRKGEVKPRSLFWLSALKAL